MAKKASEPIGLVMAKLDAFKALQEELEEHLRGDEHRVQVAKNAIAENEAKIKVFEEWLADHNKPAERDKSVIFEACAPGGMMYRVFEDGSAEGFPEGTTVYNRWLSILQYIEGAVIKEQHGRKISDDQAAMFLKWKGLNPSDALASRLYQLACLTLDAQAAQESAHSHQE